MKTALYGVACIIVGGLIERNVGPVSNYGLVIGISAALIAIAAGFLLEALTINQFVWGEDRHER